MARVLNRDNLEYHSDTTATTSPLPIRWMAPESIKASVYTEKSDVWSFAVFVCATLGPSNTRGVEMSDSSKQ